MKTATYEVIACQGIGQNRCPNGLDFSYGVAEAVIHIIEVSGWPAFLEKNVQGKIGYHHLFRASIAACANGCSRPHIADIGFIATTYPKVDSDACIGCGMCIRGCPDHAIFPQDEGVQISRDLCLGCGKCIRTCNQSALLPARSGYRVLVGGTLGRHPRLGRELPGLFSAEEALHILDIALRFMMKNYAMGRNLATIMKKAGTPFIFSGTSSPDQTLDPDSYRFRDRPGFRE